MTDRIAAREFDVIIVPRPWVESKRRLETRLWGHPTIRMDAAGRLVDATLESYHVGANRGSRLYFPPTGDTTASDDGLADGAGVEPGPDSSSDDGARKSTPPPAIPRGRERRIRGGNPTRPPPVDSEVDPANTPLPQPVRGADCLTSLAAHRDLDGANRMVDRRVVRVQRGASSALEGPMNDSSRTQGGLICVGVVIVGAVFLLGLLQQSYWAVALPVAILVFFVLGLTFWVGYTIATIQVGPYQDAPPVAERDAGASPSSEQSS